MIILFLADAQNVHTQKWAVFFAEKGHNVHVISFLPHNIKNVTVHHIKQNIPIKISKTASVFQKFGYLFYPFIIKKLVKKIEPDILHAHWATSYGLMGAIANYHPFLISTWGQDVYNAINKSFIYKWLLTYNLDKADVITATSKELVNATMKFTDKKVIQIPFGVDTNLFKPIKIEKKSDNIRIGVVKKLEWCYGIEYLVEAFDIIYKNNKNIELYIVGDGSERSNLENQVKNLGLETVVTFTGMVDNEKLYKIYNTIDVFVVPSLIESFGVVAIEAAACGCPIVATNVNGLPETLIDGETGFLVPPKSPSALAEKILYLIKNENSRKRMGVAAREFIVQNYHWNNNAQQMLDLYNSILDEQL